jgi:hypothetical protein
MKNIIMILQCLIVVITISCNSTQSQNEGQKKNKDQYKVMQDSIDRLAKATEEKFRAMTNDQLIPELEQSALKGREPFNSAPFREVIKRKDAADPLFKSITTLTRKEYFKLMALKKLNTDLYNAVKPDSGAAILTDALANSEFFNAWGIPDVYWESSAKAIIEYGPASTPYLEKLLDDHRPAPVWGSEETAIYERFKFRVCDYALALIYALSPGDKKPLPESPQERDTMIKTYKEARKK